MEQKAKMKQAQLLGIPVHSNSYSNRDNQSTEGAGGLGIIKGNKVGEFE